MLAGCEFGGEVAGGLGLDEWGLGQRSRILLLPLALRHKRRFGHSGAVGLEGVSIAVSFRVRAPLVARLALLGRRSPVFWTGRLLACAFRCQLLLVLNGTDLPFAFAHRNIAFPVLLQKQVAVSQVGNGPGSPLRIRLLGLADFYELLGFFLLDGF